MLIEELWFNGSKSDWFSMLVVDGRVEKALSNSCGSFSSSVEGKITCDGIEYDLYDFVEYLRSLHREQSNISYFINTVEQYIEGFYIQLPRQIDKDFSETFELSMLNVGTPSHNVVSLYDMTSISAIDTMNWFTVSGGTLIDFLAEWKPKLGIINEEDVFYLRRIHKFIRLSIKDIDMYNKLISKSRFQRGS